MIGISLHSRSVWSPRPRRCRAASGRRSPLPAVFTARRSSASSPLCGRHRLKAGVAQDDLAARGGSAARRRRRGPAPPRSRFAPGRASRRRSWCPAPAATRPRSRRRWPRRSPWRSPGRARCRLAAIAIAALERLEDPLPLALGYAWALVDHAHGDLVAEQPRLRPEPARRRRGGPRSRAGWRRRARAGRHRPRPSAARGRSRAAPTSRLHGRLAGGLEHLGEVDRLPVRLRLARPPAATCRAGSRPGARAVRPRRRSPRSAPPAPRRVGVAEPSAEPPAMIEVRGVRRSCEIERSSAVFSSSLRRSASASTISACIRSRSRVSAASSASARSASSRRRSASSARARARPATVLLTTATITNATSATQFSSSAIVKPVQRRDLEEVEGERAGHRGEQPQPQPPDDRDQQDRRQVDDPQRDHRRNRLERVDEQRARRHRCKRRQQPEPSRRRLPAQPK